MNIIKRNSNYTLEIKKSKFICYLYSINNEDDVNILLNNLKKEYKDASHYCYAYTLINKQKYSDDKEPSGTAGIPMLDILNKYELVNTLAVIIRYFGGIKLGASGLTRAYRNSLNDTIKISEIIPYKEYVIKNISFKYEDEGLINKYLNDVEILDKIYKENIIYKIKIAKDDLNILDNLDIKIEN